jgi:hypothetical protein
VKGHRRSVVETAHISQSDKADSRDSRDTGIFGQVFENFLNQLLIQGGPPAILTAWFVGCVKFLQASSQKTIEQLISVNVEQSKALAAIQKQLADVEMQLADLAEKK